MVIPPLKKDSSKEKKDQAGTDKKRNKTNSFGSMLDSEQERVKAQVEISSVGYTKEARPMNYHYQSREY